VLVWYFLGLLWPAFSLAGLAFFFTYFAEEFTWPKRIPWLSESSSSDSGGSSGEGGTFGGGGASGSW
jgi:uncharacterized membrane protein YgcG